MAFVKIEGVEGKIYDPRSDLKGHKKHPCKDCFSCQMCTDDRCELCRKDGKEVCLRQSCGKVKIQAGNK